MPTCSDLLNTAGPTLELVALDDGEGVIVTQVVPHRAENLSGAAGFREALGAFDLEARPGFVSLEGHLAAKVLVEGSRAAGGTVDREAVIDGLEALNGFDLGIGAGVTYGPAELQASHDVWPAVIRGGKFEPLDWTAVKVAGM